jgi:hypothetical protein
VHGLGRIVYFYLCLPSFSGIKKKCNEHDVNSQVDSQFYDEETMHKLSGRSFLSFIDFSICHSLRACTDLEVNETAGDKKRELCRGKRAAGIVAKKSEAPEIYVIRLSGTTFLALIKSARSLIAFLNPERVLSVPGNVWELREGLAR